MACMGWEFISLHRQRPAIGSGLGRAWGLTSEYLYKPAGVQHYGHQGVDKKLSFGLRGSMKSPSFGVFGYGA